MKSNDAGAEQSDSQNYVDCSVWMLLDSRSMWWAIFHISQYLFQLEEEEEELEDKFDISVSVKDPEKIGEVYLYSFFL